MSCQCRWTDTPVFKKMETYHFFVSPQCIELFFNTISYLIGSSTSPKYYSEDQRGKKKENKQEKI